MKNHTLWSERDRLCTEIEQITSVIQIYKQLKPHGGEASEGEDNEKVGKPTSTFFSAQVKAHAMHNIVF